jgi:uncharacterized membrane protein YfcA
MLNTLPCTLANGILLGFLTGVGVGGGSLLMLWLTLVLDMEHSAARIINLYFFIPSALVATLFRWRQGKLDISYVFPAAIAGCISACFFSALGSKIDTMQLKKLFGTLLLVTGVRELFYKPRGNNQRPRKAK